MESCLKNPAPVCEDAASCRGEGEGALVFRVWGFGGSASQNMRTDLRVDVSGYSRTSGDCAGWASEGVHTDLHYRCPGYSNSLISVDEEEWAGTAKGHIHAGKIEAHGISD